jgi:hypothetical protein
MKKNILIATALALAGLPGLWANTAPTVVIQSATMRPGTTFMDIVFRVNDPDDATVKTRALAFKDGVRSFANVIKPTAFVEGTGSKIGDAIPANANHTITWDVAADWDVQLGQVKFEVLAMDGRGLLPFEWITIPQFGENQSITISLNSPTDEEILNALFWEYADSNPDLQLSNGILTGTASSGVFEGVELSIHSEIQNYAAPFIFKKMNLSAADIFEVKYLERQVRIGINSGGWHAKKQAYSFTTILLQIPSRYDTGVPPKGIVNVSSIAAGVRNSENISIAIGQDGTLMEWGVDFSVVSEHPFYEYAPFFKVTNDENISFVTSPFYNHAVYVKGDGTISKIIYAGGAGSPLLSNLSHIQSAASGNERGLLLRKDKTVLEWSYGKEPSPVDNLNGVVAISTGFLHNLALTSNGTVVAWGNNAWGQITTPQNLTDVVAVAAGSRHSLALKSNGTLAAWGDNSAGQINLPDNLSGVTSIVAAGDTSVALLSDGTVKAWGRLVNQKILNVSNLKKINGIALSENHFLAFKKGY